MKPCMAAASSGGFGVKHRLSPGEVWRATDFWREALLNNTRKDIQLYNKHDLSSDATNYEKINTAKQQQKLPADFFVDVTDWLWSVKEDGYLVKLIRNEKHQWSMRTRKNTLLFPPPAFLQGLAQNKELPSFMVGELVTNFTGCAEDDRTDKDKRNKMRNEQFSRLNRVLHDKHGNKDVWDGLRVKIFSFPHSSMDLTDTHSMRSMQDTYEHYSKVMQKTLQYHPHIGMCRFGILKNTQQAIQIFNMVVQLGLEGIVIVHPDVQYGALTDPHTGDNAEKKLFFKLKQKIVLPGRKIRHLGKKAISKDGQLENQYQYTIMDENNQTITFIDQQHRTDGSYSRIKYMEFVPGDGRGEGFDSFPCMQGYRHMHFATDDDESVQVPVSQIFNLDCDIEKVLAWDKSKNRILNWDKIQDEQTLKDSSPEYKLFNPKPFKLEEALQIPYPSLPSSPDSSQPSSTRLTKRPKSLGNWLTDIPPEDIPQEPIIEIEDHSDEDTARSVRQRTPYDVHVWPAPKEEDSELIHLQWQLRPEPRETDTEEMKRAWDEGILKDLRSQERKKIAKTQADEEKVTQLQQEISVKETARRVFETQLQNTQNAAFGADETAITNLCFEIGKINNELRELERKLWLVQREIKSEQDMDKIVLEHLRERVSSKQTNKQASNMYYIISSFRNI